MATGTKGSGAAVGNRTVRRFWAAGQPPGATGGPSLQPKSDYFDSNIGTAKRSAGNVSFTVIPVKLIVTE